MSGVTDMCITHEPRSFNISTPGSLKPTVKNRVLQASSKPETNSTEGSLTRKSLLNWELHKKITYDLSQLWTGLFRMNKES